MAVWSGAVTTLRFHFISGLPRANNDLSYAPHRLRVAAHHGDGAHICKMSSAAIVPAADTTFSKSHILGDGYEVVADHEHVQVLIDGIDRKGTRRIG